MPTRRSMSVVLMIFSTCMASHTLHAESALDTPQPVVSAESGIAKQFLRDVWRTLRVNTPRPQRDDQRSASPTVVAGLRGANVSSAPEGLQPYWKDELETSREFNDAVSAFEEAHLLLGRGDFDNAEKALLAFMDDHPGSPLKANAQLALGLVYGERGEEARSVQMLSQLQQGGNRNSSDPMLQAAEELMESMM